MPWLQKGSMFGVALAILTGCTTVAPRHELAVATPEDQLPASYPRPEDFGLMSRPAAYDVHSPYSLALAKWFAPPPADQPQPKLVCDEPNAPVQTIWKGQKLVSAWEIRNEGGATLRVRINT